MTDTRQTIDQERPAILIGTRGPFLNAMVS